MRQRPTFGTALVGAVLAGLVLAAPARAALPETLELDAYDAAEKGWSGPVESATTLAEGKYFVATVSGTYSNFRGRLWSGPPWGVCGRPEGDAMFPSTGRSPSPVNNDPEWIFARPDRSTGNCRPLPKHSRVLQLSTAGANGTFAHLDPIGGAGSAPLAGHTYSYLLAGAGAKAALRLRDTNTRDNYGVLRIGLRAATPADCGADATCLAATQPPPGAKDDAPPPDPPGGGRLGISEPGCIRNPGFRSTGPVPRNRGLTLRFRRLVRNPVSVDILRMSSGKPVRATPVARFRGRTRTFVWNGRTAKRDGLYVVRYRIRAANGSIDRRSHTLARRGGRFRNRRPHVRRRICGLIEAFKVRSPAFGGRSNGPLRIAYRLTRTARVTVTIARRGGRIVRRFPAEIQSPGRTYRLFVRSRQLARGEYVVRLTASELLGVARAKVFARRL